MISTFRHVRIGHLVSDRSSQRGRTPLVALTYLYSWTDEHGVYAHPTGLDWTPHWAPRPTDPCHSPSALFFGEVWTPFVQQRARKHSPDLLQFFRRGTPKSQSCVPRRGHRDIQLSFRFWRPPGLRLADADFRVLPPIAREALCRTPPAALKTAFSVSGVLDKVKNCSFEGFCSCCDMNAHTCPADR
jgi:hypothetical protein